MPDDRTTREARPGGVARRLAALPPWQRRGVTLLAGGLSVLAMPPFGLWPVLAVTLPCLVLLLDAAAALPLWQGLRRGAGTGWLFGFGYFLAGLYWIGSAFLVEAEKFAWLMPAAVTAMPAGLGLFWAAAGAGAVSLWRPGAGRVLVFAAAFGLAEWLRGTVLTGFPWNTLGLALAAHDPLLQSAAVLGTYGLTLVTLLTLTAPVLLLGPARPLRWGGPALAVATLFAMALWGAWRVPAAPSPAVPDLTLRLVQPNTPEREKFDPAAQRGIFAELLELSGSELGAITAPPGTNRRLVIWPEVAVNALLLEEPAALAAIAQRLPPGSLLATGTMRRAAPGEVAGAAADAGRPSIYNSLAVIDGEGTGRIAAVYDKAHLVPFGEYLPMQQALESIGLESLTRMRGGFAVGPGTTTITLPGIPPFGPLICYEIIFPGAVTSQDQRPDWLLNVTNDAWFGISTGPYQHAHMARVRAVEEGLPVVRVAGTGISVVYDAYGRQRAVLPLATRGALDTGLPVPLPPTLYARFGDGIFALLMALTLLAVWWLPDLGRGSPGQEQP